MLFCENTKNQTKNQREIQIAPPPIAILPGAEHFQIYFKINKIKNIGIKTGSLFWIIFTKIFINYKYILLKSFLDLSIS